MKAGVQACYCQYWKSLNTVPVWIYCLFSMYTGVGNIYSNITKEKLKFHIPTFSNCTDKNHFEEYSKLVSGKTLQRLLLIKRRFPAKAKFGCYIHVLITIIITIYIIIITIMFFWHLLTYNQCLDANNDMGCGTVHLISASENQTKRPSEKQKKEFHIKLTWNESLDTQVFPLPNTFFICSKKKFIYIKWDTTKNKFLNHNCISDNCCDTSLFWEPWEQRCS